MIKTKTIIDIFDQLVLDLESHARHLENLERIRCGDERNVKIALAFYDLKANFTAKVARLYIAAAKYSIKRNPGPADHVAFHLLQPAQSEYECFRKEKLAQLREQNLSDSQADVHQLDQLPTWVWRDLFCASIDILLELDFDLHQNDAGDFFRVKQTETDVVDQGSRQPVTVASADAKG